jgi:ubiquinone/menaquinone biosynthesis C-methylase UbiE
LNTYGLDTSKKIISKRNRGKFVLGDAKKLPFKNDSFNLVWSAGLLEHLIPPDDVILESKRVAKTFIAFVPSNIEPLGRMKNVYGKMVIHSKKTFYVLLKKFFDKVEVKRYHLTIMGLGIDKK